MMRSALILPLLPLLSLACGSTEGSPESQGDAADSGVHTPPTPGMDAAAAADASTDSAIAHDASLASPDAAPSNDTDATAPPGWTLIWSDEFDGPNGADVDPTKWVHDVGDGSNVSSGTWQPGNGWGNDELQYYTDGTANTQQQDGNLVITAMTAGASAYKCWYGTCQWTSGRIKTYVGPPAVKSVFTHTYGRFEMRAQIPAGVGLWPAFWMMGTKLFTSSWPACGELDIMEVVGEGAGTVYGTSHSTASGDDGVPHQTTLPGGAALSSAFHVYAMEWTAASITWSLDGTVYGTEPAPASPTTANWPFSDPNDPFFLILNLALSNGDKSSWGAPPNAQTANPAHMLVDYVRVYAQSGSP